MLPLIARATQEMLLLVPSQLREAADALGVSRWRTVIGVVIPSALGGIVTGTVLAVARAAGETAPVLITCSIFNRARSRSTCSGRRSPTSRCSSSPPPRRPTRPGSRRAWGAALVLLTFILLANIAARHAARPQPEEAHRMTAPLPQPSRHGAGAHPAAARHRPARPSRVPRETVFDVRDVIGRLRRQDRDRAGEHADLPQRGDGAHRPVRLRQVDVPAQPEPHERLDPRVRSAGRSSTTATTCTGRGVDRVEVRRRIGMVFQKPNPFPKSIYDNVAWAPRNSGCATACTSAWRSALRGAALWDEVKDRLKRARSACPAASSSGCASPARSPCEPDVLLLDEPASALDPIATAAIEDLMHALRRRYTIVIVTHNMQQAARVSDRTAFFSLDLHDGQRVGRWSSTTRPRPSSRRPADSRTRDYVSGRFG